MDGRTGRVDSDAEVRRGVRNGLPEHRAYRYRGNGTDTLTGHLTPRLIREEIAEAEGEDYKKPLFASDVWKMGEICPQDPDSKRAERLPGTPGPVPRPRCGKPLTGYGRTGDYCGRPENHPGSCMSRQAGDRARWARPAKEAS